MLKTFLRNLKRKRVNAMETVSRTLATKKPASETQAGIPSFLNYQFLPSIENYLNEKNVMTPSPVQQLSFKYLLYENNKAQRPVCLGGPTGCGKTYAYLLPLIHHLKKEEESTGRIGRLPSRPRAVVLAPSKELIDQIYGVAKEISHHTKLKVEKVDGASNWARKLRDLEEGVDILVTNINKFERLTQTKRIQTSALRYVVFDEADVFIENGSEKEMVDYAKNFYLLGDSDKPQVQLIYASATLTNSLRIFLETAFDKDIKFLVTTDTHFNLANLKHTFVPVLNENKLELLAAEVIKLMEKSNHSHYYLIFCNSAAAVRAVDYYLKSKSIKCSSLHSDMPVRLRAEAYQNFKNKQSHIMVCSDLAARGLDFTHLNGVINFDFPKNANDYIHRAGRAGRLGNFGIVLNLYHKKDEYLIQHLEQSYQNKIPLEITQSSYALKNKESKDTQLMKKSSTNSTLPASFSDFRKEHNHKHPISKMGRRHQEKARPEMKKTKNFLRRKIIDIKKSLKRQLKVNPNNKRSKYLKRELKRKHKERLGIFTKPVFKK